jgi:predicted peptidase
MSKRKMLKAVDTETNSNESVQPRQHSSLRGKEEGEFIAKSLRTTNGLTIKYQVYLPSQYSSSEQQKRWPLILFLHGAGERGDDGIAQTQVGLGPVLREYPERFPAIVVFPQASGRIGWSAHRGLLHVMEVLEKVMQDYPVDTNRIYVTGLSMGGWGAWELAERFPNFFAAVVPIAAAKEPDEGTKNLSRIPIYAFHGTNDFICEVECTRAMVKEIQKLGNKTIQYVEFPDAGHKEAWEIAYRRPDFASWLFQQSLENNNHSSS